MMQEEENIENLRDDEEINGEELPDDYTSFVDEQRQAMVKQGIEKFRSEKLPKGEKLIKGWRVISINQWNKEQERLIIVSDLAYYRVKYDFYKHKVLKYHRISLSEVTSIQKGYFRVDRFTPLVWSKFYLRSNSESKVYGIRIFDSQDVTPNYNPFSSKQMYRTFCTTLHDKLAKAMIQDIANTIQNARRNSYSLDNIITEGDLLIPNHTPLLSYTHNRLQFGIWLKHDSHD